MAQQIEQMEQAGRPAERSAGSTAWVALWVLVAAAAVGGLSSGMVIVGGLWPFGGQGWLVWPYLFAPLLVPLLTASQRPGRTAAAFAVVAAVVVITLGLVAAGLLFWADANDWIGDRCCESAYDAPWTVWQGLALAYAALGVALLVTLVVALAKSRPRTDPASTGAR